jgi:hypothetical protein
VELGDKNQCPNCIISSLTITPEEREQRYVEALIAGRWVKADNFEDEGYPFSPDPEVKIHTDGIFRSISDEDVEFPALRIFARDGHRGGMVEEQIPSADVAGWYPRMVETIYGVGLEEVSGDLRIRMIPGGEFLTPMHQVDGNTAYALYAATCYAKIWTSAPSWDSADPRDIVESPDYVLTTVAMSLVAGAQPYFEATLSIPSSVPSGTIYVMPMFAMEYEDPLCEILNGPLNFGPVPWYLEVDESGLVTYPFVGKVVV